MPQVNKESTVRWFNELSMKDVPIVGGKNASLGEMISQLSTAGIRVPDGFATTADAFRDFLSVGDLESRIEARLATLNIEDVPLLPRPDAISEPGFWITPARATRERDQSTIRAAWDNVPVAVRSSATAEDLPKHLSPGNREFS